MAKRSGVSIRTKVYSKFKGVDFTTDPSLVDDARSPYAQNIVADMGGMPEKRPGYRALLNFSASINGIYNAEFSDVKHLLVHAGTMLYRWYEDGTTMPTELYSQMPNKKSMAVYMGGKLWIFTGVKLLVYDGTTVAKAEDNATIPLTVIASAPGGGGTTYQPINYLTGKRKVGFLADGTTKKYVLPEKSINSVNTVVVDGVEKAAGTDYTVSTSNGTVTFTTAPGTPAVSGEDNVFITYTKNVSGYANNINKCTNAVVWGLGGATDRIVAYGNPDHKNYDYICEYNDGYYWSDKNYSVVGTSETAIMGYLRMGETLAIVKEDNGQDSTIFIRSGSIGSDNEAKFVIKPTISGTGGVSKFGFGNIDDEQLFLTGNGVYALTTNLLTAEKIVQNRSLRIDPKLTNESLSSAITISFRNYFMIFINNQVYGLDGIQPKAYINRQDTSFLYECFYWTNIPAICVMKVVNEGEEQLYFGTADGNVCKFNYDIDTRYRFNDHEEPIEAILSTKADDDGDFMVYKTLLKKGNAVMLKPYVRSSAEILLRTEKDPSGWIANTGTIDIFSFEDIDFERFSFDSNDAPREILINRKVKNYKRLQIVVRNNKLDEGFGVYGVVKHYVTGNFAKR